MQVKKTTGFVPFELTLLVETEEEAKALFAIFNHSDNTALLKYNIGEVIRNTITHQYRTHNQSDIIANDITHGLFYLPKKHF